MLIQRNISRCLIPLDPLFGEEKKKAQESEGDLLDLKVIMFPFFHLFYINRRECSMLNSIVHIGFFLFFLSTCSNAFKVSFLDNGKRYCCLLGCSSLSHAESHAFLHDFGVSKGVWER
jgi:hypothetical protein